MTGDPGRTDDPQAPSGSLGDPLAQEAGEASGATVNPSRGKRVRFAGNPLANGVDGLVTGLGVIAAVLAVLAVFLPVYEITVNTLPCEPADVALAEQCSDAGSIALLPLGLLVGLLAFGAGLGGSRAAAFCLLAAGAAILVLTLAIDAPKLGETGAIGMNFERAEVQIGPAFWLELAAGILAIAAGALRVLRPWKPDERPASPSA